MSNIETLIEHLCPDGINSVPLRQIAKRHKGTNITASKMSELNKPDGDVTVFAAGNTIAHVDAADIPAKDIIRKPGIIVKSRGYIDFEFCTSPFTHKNELWSYICENSTTTKYIYYYLQTQSWKLQRIANATSVKLPQLSIGDTDNLLIPLPPIEIQQEIVQMLDTFKQLYTTLDRELTARENQKRYYLDFLFESTSGPLKPLGDLGSFTRGRRFTKSDYRNSGIPCIHYADIYTQYGTYTSNACAYIDERMHNRLRYAKPGDLVIACTGETKEDIAKAVAWLGDEPAAVHDDCSIFHHSLEPKFVAYFFQTDSFYRQKMPRSVKAKMARISAEQLSKIEMPVPAPEVQERIVVRLDSMEALIDSIQSERDLRQKQYEYYRDKIFGLLEKRS
jgi:type I restriction enzyme S subunit